MNLQEIGELINNIKQTYETLLSLRDAYMDENYMEAILEHGFESLADLECVYINTEDYLERLTN